MKNSDNIKINSVNPLYIIINTVDGSISEKKMKSIQIFGIKLTIISKQ